MFEMFGESWQCIVVMFAIPVAIAVYCSLRFRAGPLTDAMREMEEDGTEERGHGRPAAPEGGAR
jgi:hypothetical protein